MNAHTGWHDTGSLFDFTNPEVRARPDGHRPRAHADRSIIDSAYPQGLAWWKGQMDKALDLGIDGWKLDGSVRLAPFALSCSPRWLTRRMIDCLPGSVHLAPA